MSNFGKTLFSGSRFIFWTLAPVLILFAAGMPFLLTSREPIKIILTGILSLTALLLALGLWNPLRFRWALRCVSGIVFLAYVGYFIDEVFFSKDGFSLPDDRSDANTINALSGLFVIGLPCLIFTIFGRFGFARKNEDRQE